MDRIFAITSKGSSLKSNLDIRFGKCENIVIFNSQNKTTAFLKNPFKNSRKSGLRLVNFLKEKGVSVFVTGEVGPNTLEMMKKERLQLVLVEEDKIKIEELITRISK